MTVATRTAGGRPPYEAPEWAPSAGSRLRGTARRRSVPHLLVGVLLVVVCATASVVIGTAAGQRREVLALSRAVPVGHVLTVQDLRGVPVAADADVPLISAADSATVLGRTVTGGLPAGTLLSAAMVGESVPPPGRAISALALKPGQFPPELGPGMHVDVVVVAAAPAQTSTGQVVAPGSWPAVVLGVTDTENGQASVVSLDLDSRDAARVAAAGGGPVSLVVVARG